MKKYKFLYYFVFFFIIYIFYLYLYAYKNFYLNSDFVAPMLMMEDILNGNLLLKGWTGSTGYFLPYLYFFSLIPYYIFGLTKEFYLYNQTLVLALMMFFIFVLLIKHSKDIKTTLFLLFTLLLVIPEGPIAISLTWFSHHNETYMLIFLDLNLIYLIYNSTKKGKVIGYSLILFIINIAVYADKMTYYIYAIPLITIIIFNAIIIYKNQNFRLKLFNLCFILIATIMSVSTNKIIELFVKANGGIYQQGFKKIYFSSPFDWNDRLGTSLEMLLSAFNFKYFSHPLDLISLLIFILCVFYLFKTLINIKKVDIIQQFLAVSSLIFFIANIVSYVVLTHRYFVIIAIMMLVLLIYSNPFRDIRLIRNDKFYKILIFLLVLTCILFMLKNVRTDIRDLSSYDEKQKLIKEIVLKHELKSGYATFWNADVFSYFSGPDTIVAPVFVDNHNLIQRKWLSKNDWYTRYANFIVTVKSEIDKFYNILGKPKYEYRGLPKLDREETIILIYDKNLTEYLKNYPKKE